MLNYIALHIVSTQLTSSHPALPPFLWPLRSRGLSCTVTRAELYGEGRLKYPLVTAWPNMTRVSVLDTRHESEEEESDDSVEDRGSEAGEI